MSTSTTRNYTGSFSDIPWQYNNENNHTIKISNTLANINIVKDDIEEENYNKIRNQLITFFGGNLLKINDYGFYYCKQLSSAEFNQSTKEFGKCAFYGCENLKIIKNKNKRSNILELNKIDDYCFGNCSSLSSLKIYLIDVNSHQIEIGNSIFLSCSNLKNIDFYNYIYCRSNMFERCDELSSVNFLNINNNNNILVEDLAFNSTKNLLSIQFPECIDSYEKMSPNALQGSSLLSIQLDGFSENNITSVYAEELYKELSVYSNMSAEAYLGQVVDYFDYNIFLFCEKVGIPMIFIYGLTNCTTSNNFDNVLTSYNFKQKVKDLPCVVFNLMNINRGKETVEIPGQFEWRTTTGSLCSGTRCYYKANSSQTVKLTKWKNNCQFAGVASGGSPSLTIYTYRNPNDGENMSGFSPYEITHKTSFDFPVSSKEVIKFSERYPDKFEIRGFGYPYFGWIWTKNNNKGITVSKLGDKFYSISFDIISGTTSFTSEIAIERLTSIINEIINNQLDCRNFKGFDKVKYIEVEKIKKNNCWGIGHNCTLITKDGRTFDYNPL